MESLQHDTRYMPKYGEFTAHKKDKSTASRITPPTGNPRRMAKLNTVRPSSMTDTFNASDPRQTARYITQQENAKREAKIQFLEELKNRKEEEENARRETFGNKQLSRTTTKYTAISESRKKHQGGKYSRIKRKRVTRKGMRKTRAKSKKNNKKNYRKHYKRR